MAAPTLGTNWKRALMALPFNWDSYGAKQITPEAMAMVDAVAVVPCCHGGDQLEIHRDGYDIEIEIGPDGRIISGMVCAERLT